MDKKEKRLRKTALCIRVQNIEQAKQLMDAIEAENKEWKMAGNMELIGLPTLLAIEPLEGCRVLVYYFVAGWFAGRGEKLEVEEP